MTLIIKDYLRCKKILHKKKLTTELFHFNLHEIQLRGALVHAQNTLCNSPAVQINCFTSSCTVYRLLPKFWYIALRSVALRVVQQSEPNKTASSPALFANESFYRGQLPLFSLLKLNIRPWVSYERCFRDYLYK